jgi:hypothetical protein
LLALAGCALSPPSVAQAAVKAASCPQLPTVSEPLSQCPLPPFLCRAGSDDGLVLWAKAGGVRSTWLTVAPQAVTEPAALPGVPLTFQVLLDVPNAGHGCCLKEQYELESALLHVRRVQPSENCLPHVAMVLCIQRAHCVTCCLPTAGGACGGVPTAQLPHRLLCVRQRQPDYGPRPGVALGAAAQQDRAPSSSALRCWLEVAEGHAGCMRQTLPLCSAFLWQHCARLGQLANPGLIPTRHARP